MNSLARDLQERAVGAMRPASPPERVALSEHHEGVVADFESDRVEILVPNELALAYMRARRGGVRTLTIETNARGCVKRFLEALANGDACAVSGVRHLRLRVDVAEEPGVRGLLGSALDAFPALDALELYAVGGARPVAFEVVVPTDHPVRHVCFDGGHHVIRVVCPSWENRAANESRELIVRGHFEIPRSAWRRVDISVDHVEVSICEALWSVADVPAETVVLRLGRAEVVGLVGSTATGKLACDVLEIRCHRDIRTLRMTGTSFDAVGSIIVHGASVQVIVENPSLMSRIAVNNQVLDAKIPEMDT